METRLSLSFKDTKYGKYQLHDIITFCCRDNYKNVTFVLQGQSPIIISYYHSMPAPYRLIELLIAHIGFAYVAKLCHFKIDHHLVTALVERWRPQTHTFHLPVGECTITLEDVALQLGIKVDGRPIIGATCYDGRKANRSNGALWLE